MAGNKRRRAAAKQPRADNGNGAAMFQKDTFAETSGQNVQRNGSARRVAKSSGQDVQKREPARTTTESFGQNVQKSEFAESGTKTSGHDVQKKEAVRTRSKTTSGQSDQNKTFGQDVQNSQAAQKARYKCQSAKDSARDAVKHKPQTESAREFQNAESTFTAENPFVKASADGEKPKSKRQKKIDRLEKKATSGRIRTQRAKDKLTTTDYSLERHFNEQTGKVEYRLTPVKRERHFSTQNPVKQAAGRITQEPLLFAHQKISQAEQENTGVEAAHKTEQRSEDVYRFAKHHRKSKEQRLRGKVKKLEKKQFDTEVNLRYQEFLKQDTEVNENAIKKALRKKMQKNRIKREYAKAQRAGAGAKAAKETASKSKDALTAVAKKIQELAEKHAAGLVIAILLLLLLIMIMSSFASCGAMFSDGMSTVTSGSYQSVPAEMDAAELQLSELEMGLQNDIDNIENDYPDYDEYRYNLAEIGHDPFVLISYLSAEHTEFTAADVESEIEELFDEMYELTMTPTEETRTRTVTRTGTRVLTDPDTGVQTGTEEYEYEEEEEYTVTILDVKLTAKSLDTIARENLDSEQTEIYAALNESHGLVQYFYSPLDLYWYNYVSSYYGYRANPTTGQNEFHRGVDIAVPTGTTVLAAQDGTVTTAAYDDYYGNYVVIENEDGYCSKYAHMDTLSVSAGQTVSHGDTIGTTGNTGSSTGSHLHIECLYNGEYYNPLFYFLAGEGTLYGEAQGTGSGGGDAVPPESYDDATVQTLMDEAALYLGYPYVWGGSSPDTSFDCSGYVCWVFTHSGVHDLPRTTAQGIYDQCTTVSAEDAQPGDLIFFTGTYSSGGAVSHVGIYCGNGVMIHCGDPIKYSNINTSYWQSHFYAFGRLN